jgi:AAA+ ATPase superfamily predicted ATPase
MIFINRDSELSLLAELSRSGRAELLVLYGRRRVGKTELLRHFSQERAHIFFTATQSTDKNLLGSWSRLLWRQQQGQDLPGFTFPDWEASFRFLFSLARTERLVVVIDEFPYLVDANPAIPSILQKVWDEEWQHSQVFLTLCGSSIGMMEQHTLHHSSPLYGRRSGQILLPALSFTAARRFFSHLPLTEQVEAYAILGGMPAYLQRFDAGRSLAENVVSQILTPNRFLYDEPLFLLHTELREPRNYFAILQAIAQGQTRPNAIAQASGIGDARTISKYLSVLQDLRLVERVVPVTDNNPDKSRKGIYRLADNFLRFWFRFAAPYRSELEQGQGELVWRKEIEPRLPEFVGPVFEQIWQQLWWAKAKSGELPFMPHKIGSWWEPQQEIDLVAIDEAEQSLLLGECKWRNRPVGTNVLADLQRKGAVLQAQVKAKTVYYALCAKAGYTAELTQLAREEPGLYLFTLE